jgi:hypothetical protein
MGLTRGSIFFADAFAKKMDCTGPELEPARVPHYCEPQVG